jgi:non-specific serine/threonine protein kinase
MRSRAIEGNLPPELTSFVGRRRELAGAQALLSASRLVTLLGTGGVGKTRLALRVAAQVRRRYPDGVWLVELDRVRDQALVADTAASTFGLPGQPCRFSTDVLAGYLSCRKVLLILDNCEHVLCEAAKLTEVLLRETRFLQILVTSREALDINGEITLAVPPLNVPAAAPAMALDGLASSEAVALFLDRAATAVPDFALTETNRAAVAGICASLDGLPLAIELATAWLPALSPEQIRDRLSSRLALLNRGPRTAAARQQTLEHCLAWSHDLCPPQERRLWARLSVFVGGFDTEAAHGVCTDEQLTSDDLDELLAVLADKSVVIRQDQATGVRYRMPENIRAYGQDRRRACGEDIMIRRRHRDWYHDLTRRAETSWLGPRLAEWNARLDAEVPNLRAAFEFSLTDPGGAGVVLRMILATILYWRLRGRHAEARYWLGLALAHPGEPASERLKALWAIATLAASMGDVAASEQSARQLHAMAARHSDDTSQAVVAFMDALVATARGDLARAAALEQEALQGFKSHADALWEAMVIHSLTLTQVLLGDLRAAAGHHERMVELSHAQGQCWSTGFTGLALGIGLWKQGELDQAAERTARALPVLRPSMLNTSWCLEVMAWIAAGRGRLERAAVLLGAAEALAQAMGTRAAMWPDLLSYHEQVQHRTREALGEQAFRTALARGESLSLDEVVAYALDDRCETPASLPQPDHPGLGAVLSTLTHREREVTSLVAEGLSNKDIAARLVISPRTAEGHVSRIMSKLGCSSRTGLARLILDGPDHLLAPAPPQ